MAYYKATHFDHLSPIIGVLYEHAFTDKVRLGANFKANWCTVVSGHPRVYLGVPFAIQIGEKKNWELEVQPYTIRKK